ncbi:MAG: hypothetical protein QNJ97_21585 [Myxococcota bacterium]|nr:hypothetical protein [Myxococcota bacterium]
MPTLHGFVSALETRSSGWVEVKILAPHASNTVGIAYITNLDGDLSIAHRKLAQVGLLRDALAHTLPVAITYQVQENEGNVIDDVTLLPLRSIDGRLSTAWVEGVVMGVMVRERNPESTASPYADQPDEARVVILLSGGNIETYIIDLQRPLTDTGHAIRLMCEASRRTRRTLRLQVHFDREEKMGTDGGIAVGAEWPNLTPRTLKEVNAFIEQVGQRSESYDNGELRTVDAIWVRYTTAPDMVPEGDISENGSFQPVTATAWLHVDSPMVGTLKDALSQGLQVRLGLIEDEIHSVEISGPLGSAVRPIWVTVSMDPICDDPETVCINIPTIQAPSDKDLNRVPHAVAWRGDGYFNKGIWRFIILSGGEICLKIDGEIPCAKALAGAVGASKVPMPEIAKGRATEASWNDVEYELSRKRITGIAAHAYMNGMHKVQVIIRGQTCKTPFRMLVYRIR